MGGSRLSKIIYLESVGDDFVCRMGTLYRAVLVSASICLTSLTRAKCGTRSTLCWKVGNISGSTELFAL